MTLFPRHMQAILTLTAAFQRDNMVELTEPLAYLTGVKDVDCGPSSAIQEPSSFSLSVSSTKWKKKRKKKLPDLPLLGYGFYLFFFKWN